MDRLRRDGRVSPSSATSDGTQMVIRFVLRWPVTPQALQVMQAPACMRGTLCVSHLQLSMSSLIHKADAWDGYKAQYAMPELRIRA